MKTPVLVGIADELSHIACVIININTSQLSAEQTFVKNKTSGVAILKFIRQQVVYVQKFVLIISDGMVNKSEFSLNKPVQKKTLHAHQAVLKAQAKVKQGKCIQWLKMKKQDEKQIVYECMSIACNRLKLYANLVKNLRLADGVFFVTRIDSIQQYCQHIIDRKNIDGVLLFVIKYKEYQYMFIVPLDG